MKNTRYYRKPTLKKRLWGFVLFFISIIFFPLVFGITYYKNRKYQYTLKEFCIEYILALKDMLTGDFGDWRE